ncbi:tryptophan--tRNA ligase [Candidatus Saccharibacteria bacterium]|nr:tryptophan--tRNA ligase [Candidatus Saccharibacteria bacterium]
MTRIFSGIQPSGRPTIGNYIGAMKQWVELQKDNSDSQLIFSIVNLHAITARQNPEELKERTLDMVAWLLAMGIDPTRSNTKIMVQSTVPAHSELAWILDNYTTIGELNRMTQFKDKSAGQKPEGLLVGIYNYPVLMAADILLYSTDIVPVGDDQMQHIELTRDIASRFNNLYGEVFVVPRGQIVQEGSRIMNLQDPTKKMSKSSDNQMSFVLLEDSAELIHKKLSKAVTDQYGEVRYDPDRQPAISNLIDIYRGFEGDLSIEAIEKRYVDIGYGQFKQDLAVLVIDKLSDLQNRYQSFRAGHEMLIRVVDEGKEYCQKIAEQKIEQVKQVVGLV